MYYGDKCGVVAEVISMNVIVDIYMRRMYLVYVGLVMMMLVRRGEAVGRRRHRFHHCTKLALAGNIDISRRNIYPTTSAIIICTLCQ